MRLTNRIAAAVLSGAMVLSMAGCGANANANVNAAAGTPSGDSDSRTGWAPALGIAVDR